MATKTFFASSIASAGLLKEGSPAAADTTAKSFELMLAKFGRGANGPAAFLSRNMQSAGNWADRNPELAEMVGKFTLVTAGLTGLAVVVNIMAAAARNASASLTWLAASGRGAAGAQAVAGAAGSTAGSTAGTGAVAAKATGGVAAVGGRSRLGAVGGLARLAGLGLIAFDAADNLQGAFGPNRKYSHRNYSQIPNNIDMIVNPLANAIKTGSAEDGGSGFFGRYRKESIRNNVGALTDLGVGQETGVGDRLRQAFSIVEGAMGFTPSFGPRGQLPGKKPGTWEGGEGSEGGFLTSNPSQVRPQFTQIEDVHRQASLSALEDPLDAAIKNVQRQNDLDFISKAMGKGLDESETGKKIRSDQGGMRP
jgi:hypothetical protein